MSVSKCEPTRYEALRAWPSNALVPALKLSSQTLLGIIATPYSILFSWEPSEKECVNELATLTGKSREILPLLILHTGKIFNPKFQYQERSSKEPVRSCTRKLLHPLQDKFVEYSGRGKCLQAKLVALITIPVAIVARVADFALGVFLVLPTQLYYLGSDPYVNSRTCELLNLPALIGDGFHGVRGLFIPLAECNNQWNTYSSRTPYLDYLKPITKRVSAVVELPIVALQSALNVHILAIGILAVPYSILTLGCFKKINESASMTIAARAILPELLIGAVKVFNPYFVVNEEDVVDFRVRDQACQATFSTQLTGALLERLQECVQRGNFFEREITSRTISLVIIPVAVAARVADLALGLFLVLPTQAYYWGTNYGVNTTTFQLFNVLALVDDLAFGIRGLFTPKALWKRDDSQQEREALERHLSAIREAEQRVLNRDHLNIDDWYDSVNF